MEIARILELVRKGKLETGEAEKLIQSVYEENGRGNSSERTEKEISDLNERLTALEVSFGEFLERARNFSGTRPEELEVGKD